MQPFIVDIGGTIMSLKERAAALKTDIPAVFFALKAKETPLIDSGRNHRRICLVPHRPYP